MRPRSRRLGIVLSLALLGGLAACAPMPGPVAMGGEPAPMFERRIVSAVNFNFDSYRIRPDSYALLDNAALALNDPQLGGLRFEINGHTDITGRLGYNISLSMLRATAVLDYLAARGVPRERMRAQGFGPLQPFDAYNPRSPVNRRVEIVALR
jgi:outer membrane protein OmpA-like peptidoglycan-associated protein